jgi:hypothetical protein
MDPFALKDKSGTLPQLSVDYMSTTSPMENLAVINIKSIKPKTQQHNKPRYVNLKASYVTNIGPQNDKIFMAVNES